jgi:hypothetical protein
VQNCKVLVSGYLNTFRDSIGSLAHCVDNDVPGILNWAEMRVEQQHL